MEKEEKTKVIQEENKTIMGKFFIKIGMYIQLAWCDFQCKWNCFLLKLKFKAIKCNKKLCTCEK